MKKETRFYNFVFPLSLFLLYSPLFWVTSAVVNFAIDSIVLVIILMIVFKTVTWKSYSKTILKVWICGYIADIIGALCLTVSLAFLRPGYYYGGHDIISQMKNGIYYAMHYSPFRSPWGVAYVFAGILIAAVFIFVLNYFISFKSLEMTKMQKVLSSLTFAVFTAPYTFLLPSEMFG